MRWPASRNDSPAVAADPVRYTTLVDLARFTIIVEVDLPVALGACTPMFNVTWCDF